MGLLGFRPALLIAFFALFFYMAWGLGNGYVTWQKPDHTKTCFGGYRWIKAVDKQPWLHAGRLTLLYQPWSWSCPQDNLYDSAVYEVRDGALVPRGSATSVPALPNQP